MSPSVSLNVVQYVLGFFLLLFLGAFFSSRPNQARLRQNEITAGP